jgi:hypothetical protein
MRLFKSCKGRGSFALKYSRRLVARRKYESKIEHFRGRWTTRNTDSSKGHQHAT